MVLFLFVTTFERPAEKIRFAGTPDASLRSRIWLSVIVFDRFPVVVPVPIRTTPTAVVVGPASMTELRMVLLDASAESVKAGEVVSVFLNVRNLPLPPNRPSTV